MKQELTTKKKFTVALLGANSPHILRIAESLSQRGHRVAIIAPGGKPVVEVPNVKHFLFDRTLFTTAKIKQIRGFLKEIKPDILHSHFINYGGLIGLSTGFHPHVSSAWGCDVLNVPNISLLEKLKVILTLRSLDGVLPVSEQLKERVDELVGGGHFNKIYHWGLDTQMFSPSEENRQKGIEFRKRLGITGPLVLSSRAMQPIYRQHVLLDAWAIVIRKAPEARLVFCPFLADDDYAVQLRKQIQNLKISDSLIWLDGLPYSEIPGAYMGSDVVISIPRTDGTPFTILEAMACERPIVASDLDSVKKWLSPSTNSIFVDGGEPQSVAQGLLKMLGRLDRDNSVAREIILERADRQKCIDNLESIYGEIIGKRKSNKFSWLETVRNISRSLKDSHV